MAESRIVEPRRPRTRTAKTRALRCPRVSGPPKICDGALRSGREADTQDAGAGKAGSEQSRADRKIPQALETIQLFSDQVPRCSIETHEESGRTEHVHTGGTALVDKEDLSS